MAKPDTNQRSLTFRTPAAARFWSKVDRNGPLPEHRPDLGPCWPWTGFVDGDGYGRFRDEYGQVAKAHRWSYGATHGPIPDGLQPDHLCRVRRCVRPEHLEAVTPRVNVLRGTSFAAKFAKATHCVQGHPFCGDNLVMVPGPCGPSRSCRTCRKQRKQEYRARQRAAR